MGILWNKTSENAMGGTELLCHRLEETLPKELLDEVQIIPSRLDDDSELDYTKVRIAWMHDSPGDPASDKLFKNEGWRKFHKVVFVSNWQMQRYIEFYRIPWSKCIVIQNGIIPFTDINKDEVNYGDGKIHMIYTSTPHRGLDVLASAWEMVSKNEPNFSDKFHLDVFSSFALYGWEERNKEFDNLFNYLKNNETITYHGTKSNDEVREALAKSRAFLYPSVYPETSCLCLIEAMSAGLICLHSNFAALPETSCNLTKMYQYNEDKTEHVKIFASLLAMVSNNIDELSKHLQTQKNYVNSLYHWENKVYQWSYLVKGLIDLPRENAPNPTKMFSYSTSQ